MSDAAPSAPDRSPLQKWARIWLNRPTLLAAIAVGILVSLGLALAPNPLKWSTRAILSWDAGALWFILAMMRHMTGSGIAHMEATADQQDEGRGLILTVVMIACAISIAAITAELGLAKSTHGVMKVMHVSLAGVTVAVSWFVMQLVFALHYAHRYYSPDELPGSRGRARGLRFPGGEDPDYWDFLHFSVVIGTAAQTADIEFTSKPLRRIGTVHSLIAFTFNTVVLALSINLLASLA
ncbi:MAG: hypothetical protein CFE28_03845 [Alphaproteobacteria bacterium PA2]|nr:MAG: hypothetical protein CFE28_03845 [Alphaproteobacteria bacterium PA2]